MTKAGALSRAKSMLWSDHTRETINIWQHRGENRWIPRWPEESSPKNPLWILRLTVDAAGTVRAVAEPEPDAAAVVLLPEEKDTLTRYEEALKSISASKAEPVAAVLAKAALSTEDATRIIALKE